MKYLRFLVIVLCFILVGTYTIKGAVTVSATDGNSASDMLRNFADETQGDAQEVSQRTGVFVDVIGTIVSAIVIILFALIVLQTALDICYLAVPFMRDVLYKEDNGGMQPQMQGQMQGQSQKKVKYYISSELKRLITTSGTQCSACNSYMRQNQVTSTTNKWKEYFGARVKFMILIAVVTTMLVGTQVFTECGWNIGKFILLRLGFGK